MSIWKKCCATLLCLTLILTNVPCHAAEYWDWNKAYYSFLMDGLFKSSGQTYFDNKDSWAEPQFALYDLNLDGVPELLAYNGCGYTADARGYLYAFSNGGIAFCGEIGSDLYGHFYYEGNAQYPGLFFNAGGMGEFTLYYVQLEGTQMILEPVADWDMYNDTNANHYHKRTEDDDLFNLNIAVLQDQPSDNTHIQPWSLDQISSMGWDSFTAKYRAGGEEKSLSQLPRVTFNPNATEQLTVYWETDETHLYEMSVVNALTGEDARLSPQAPGQYGKTSVSIEQNGVYEITIRTLDADSMELVAETTLYVSVVIAPPLTQEQQEQEMIRRGSQNFINRLATKGSEENQLLNSLFADYEQSFAHIYMGLLDENLEYQVTSAGYLLLSDTVGFVIDGINDIINDPVEMELIQVLTDYLINQEREKTEKYREYAETASWIGDMAEFLTDENWGKMMEAVDSGIDTLNSGLKKIFTNIPDDLVKGIEKYALKDSNLAKMMDGKSKYVSGAGKLISGVIALLDYANKECHNTAVVSLLMGNYLENIRILGELAEQAQTEQMKSAIQRVTRWMTNQLEDDLGQLYDETSEMGKWVLSLAVDLSVDFLAEQAAGNAAKTAGNVLGGVLLGQAIGSLLTKSAGDTIDANKKVAAANNAAYILKLETDHAVHQESITALTWLAMFTDEVQNLNEATVLAVDTVHRESFLRAVGDFIRNIHGRELNDQDYAMITDDMNRTIDHRIQLMEAKTQCVIDVREEVQQENAVLYGMAIYDQPEPAIVDDDGCQLYTSPVTGANDLVGELPAGSEVNILGELLLTKNEILWYLVSIEDGSRAFVPATSVVR